MAPVSAAEPPTLTKPVQVTTGDVDPGRTYTTPSLAVDPSNPLNIVATLSEARTRKCGLMRSGNGGQTWERLDASPALPSHPYCFTANFAASQALVAFRPGSPFHGCLHRRRSAFHVDRPGQDLHRHPDRPRQPPGPPAHPAVEP